MAYQLVVAYSNPNCVQSLNICKAHGLVMLEEYPIGGIEYRSSGTYCYNEIQRLRDRLIKAGAQAGSLRVEYAWRVQHAD